MRFTEYYININSTCYSTAPFFVHLPLYSCPMQARRARNLEESDASHAMYSPPICDVKIVTAHTQGRQRQGGGVHSHVCRTCGVWSSAGERFAFFLFVLRAVLTLSAKQERSSLAFSCTRFVDCSVMSISPLFHLFYLLSTSTCLCLSYQSVRRPMQSEKGARK